MEQFSFVFTILFMLLGPVKIIPAFAQLTAGADETFKRGLALRGAAVASAVVAFVAVTGVGLLDKYRISIDALRIAGGLVLLLAALGTIFPKPQSASAAGAGATPLQLAVSPLATPVIVPPAGVAAILVFMMLDADYPGIRVAVAAVLAIIMVLDFLVMHFHARIVSVPGLMLVLQVVGSVLIFMQVALSIEVVLSTLRHLGAI